MTMTTTASISIFSPLTLPADVKSQYTHHMIDKKVILQHHVNTEIDGANGKHHYLVGTPQKYVILNDGTLFVMLSSNELKEKELFWSPVPCTSDMHSGIHVWYKTFGSTCHDYGYYVHPIWLFRKDIGGHWGFTCGDGADDDIPSHLRIGLNIMSSTLFRLLMTPKMFPPDSKKPELIQQCKGDGYAVLKQILFNSHPAFHEQPSTLIPAYPKQTANMSLVQWYNVFMDYLQLCTVIHDVDASLNDKMELDLFITHAFYGDYLNRVTHEE